MDIQNLVIENNTILDVHVRNDVFGTLIIPEGIVAIGKNAFTCCNQVKKIIFPSTLEEISSSAFESCVNLEEIDLSNTDNIKIGNSAFRRCLNLKKIDFPKNIYSIDNIAFALCEKLRQVNLNNVEDIGIAPFLGCKCLEYITINDNKKYCDKDCNIIYDMKSNKIIQGCSTSKIPEGTKIIGEKAFCCNIFKEIIFPNTLKTICDYAFSGCDINEIYLNEGLEYIGVRAFSENKTITSIIIPSSVTNIDNAAFEKCENLKEVSIEGNTTINPLVFQLCDNLENIYIYSPQAVFEFNITTNNNAIIYAPNNMALNNNFAHEFFNEIKPFTLKMLIEDKGKSIKEANDILKTSNIER